MKKEDVVEELRKIDEFKSRINTLIDQGYNPPKKISYDISNLEKKIKKNFSILSRLSNKQKIAVILFCIITVTFLLLIFIPGLNHWESKVSNTPKTMELMPVADTYVERYVPNINHGNDNKMILSDQYGPTNDYDARGMILFNLSKIPSGSTIVSANLTLYYEDYNGTNPIGREITCHRILENWDEMNVTYNTMPNSDPIECASTILPGYFTWVYWDVTSEVDDFVNNGAKNYGWMIRDYKEPWGGANIPQQYYWLSEAKNFHPKLIVCFNPP
jgi:hypothetical protein